MLKCNGEKPVSSYTIKKQISLCCFYIIFFLIQTSALRIRRLKSIHLD